MKEISLHILDIVQNSVQANATEIEISIEESSQMDLYTVTIIDNGDGMSCETINRVLDPFFTTKNKKTGLGIPLLKQHAELTGGKLEIESTLNVGTTVRTNFIRSNIDRQPLGEIESTLSGIFRSFPNADFSYTHKVDNKEFFISTKEIKNELDGVSITSHEVISFIKELILENITEIGAT